MKTYATRAWRSAHASASSWSAVRSNLSPPPRLFISLTLLSETNPRISSLYKQRWIM
jgi:hypothetical protein